MSDPNLPADAQPIDDALRSRVLAPFLTGLEVALREVARTEVVERTAYQCKTRRVLGDWGAYIELRSDTEGVLALGFEQATAAALAQRMLADANVVPDVALVRDCACELANVVAGQAKAFLAGTPDRFTFSPPTLTSADLEIVPAELQKCLVVVFDSEVGVLLLQLFLHSSVA